jgi:hypothetical protein
VGAIVRRANLLLQDAGYIIDFTIPTSGDLVDETGQPIKVVSVRQEPHYDGLPFMGLRPFNHKVMYAQADAISINRQTGELGLYVSQHPDAKIIPANKVAQLRDLDSIALNGVDYLPPGVQARVNFRGLAWASLGDHNWRRSVTVGRSGYSHHGYLGTWMSDHWRNVRQETPGAYRLYYVLKLTWGDTEPGRRMPNDPTGTSGLYTFYLDPANGELVCAEFDHVNDLLFRSGSGAEAPAPNLLAWAPAGDERAEAWGGLTAAKAPATYSKGVPVTMIATDDSILTFQWHEASGLVSQNGRYYKPEKPLAAALQAYESPKVKAPQWHKLAEASAPNN